MVGGRERWGQGAQAVEAGKRWGRRRNRQREWERGQYGKEKGYREQKEGEEGWGRLKEEGGHEGEM